MVVVISGLLGFVLGFLVMGTIGFYEMKRLKDDLEKTRWDYKETSTKGRESVVTVTPDPAHEPASTSGPE